MFKVKKDIKERVKAGSEEIYLSLFVLQTLVKFKVEVHLWIRPNSIFLLKILFGIVRTLNIEIFPFNKFLSVQYSIVDY